MVCYCRNYTRNTILLSILCYIAHSRGGLLPSTLSCHSRRFFFASRVLATTRLLLSSTIPHCTALPLSLLASPVQSLYFSSGFLVWRHDCTGQELRHQSGHHKPEASPAKRACPEYTPLLVYDENIYSLAAQYHDHFTRQKPSQRTYLSM